MEIEVFKRLIWEYTKKITDSTNIAFNSIGSKHGLTMMQMRLLMELQRSEKHTIGSLAGDICMAGANISSLCKKLEQQGLLQKKRDSNDERVVIIRLTEEGKRTVMAIDSYFNQRLSKSMEKEAEETYDSIIEGMEKLNTLLKNIVADEEISR
jgi:DNA-binding MarR family transcriptional regulator